MPDKDDWKKLIRVLGYLKGTMDYDLMISCTSLQKLTWYNDVTYVVHEDMKGQSGAVLMIGKMKYYLGGTRENKQKKFN